MTGIATRLIDDLQRRRRTNGHSILGIQGEPGVGKSTCACCIARNLEPDFSPDHIYYERGDVWDEIAEAPKGQVFILDEGTNIMMNRTWQDRDQVSTAQLLTTIRQRHHTLIWCTPNLARLDIVVRDDLLTHKVNCIRRGSARVRTRRLDRDGEAAGWVTWPGYLAWPSLDNHPIWGPYYQGKEDAYRAIVNRRRDRRADATAGTVEDAQERARQAEKAQAILAARGAQY